jgi:hypothetical protein
VYIRTMRAGTPNEVAGARLLHSRNLYLRRSATNGPVLDTEQPVPPSAPNTTMELAGGN